MLDPWMLVAFIGIFVVGLSIYFLTRGGTSPTPPVAEGRAEQLSRRMAKTVGCTMRQALPAIERELDIAPNQTDETLLKRAIYHFQRDQPERLCTVYRDSAPT